MSINAGKIRIAYLLSRYPAVSHTFFLKEILGLRQIGFEIATASINPPDRHKDQLPPCEAKEADGTYYIKQTSLWKTLYLLFLVTLVHPMVLYRGVRGALKLHSWDIYRRAYTFFYLVEAILLGDWMTRNGLSHLHVHFGGSVATVALLTAEAWGFDYSMTIHGPEEFYEVEPVYLARKVEQAKFIFCISNFCRSQLMKYSDANHWNKMYFIRLGVNPEEFTPDPSETSSPLRILCVGRLVPAKGQHILLRAFIALRERGHDLHLTLVGNGPDRSSLESAVAAHNLSDRVTFCGALNHDQTRELLRSADIFALASFAEGVPVALMEAMAMEIPCVSTIIAGIPELIRDGVDGLLVPASSVEALTAAIEQLIDNPNLRKQLGASARERIIERYNLPVNLKTLASKFESCLS